MIALDKVTGIGKISLVKELKSIRDSLPSFKGAEKLLQVKRIREIRELLSLSAGSEPKPLEITFNPNDKKATYLSLISYIENGLKQLPPGLIQPELTTLSKINSLLTKMPGDQPDFSEVDWRMLEKHSS